MGTKTFDRDLVTRWIEALESGEYAQGRDCLNDGCGHMCCLGVLCDTIDPARWVLADADDQVDPERGTRLAWDGEGMYLPDSVADLVGLTYTGAQPDVRRWSIDGDEYAELSGANDQGIPFPDIAAALRDFYGVH
jgi:hypothetical protein